jgi:hypothetical protein
MAIRWKIVDESGERERAGVFSCNVVTSAEKLGPELRGPHSLDCRESLKIGEDNGRIYP